MTPFTIRAGSRIVAALSAVMLAAGCATAITGAPLAATAPGADSGATTAPSASDPAEADPQEPEGNDSGDHVITENPTSEPTESWEPSEPSTSGEPEKTGVPEPTTPGSTSPEPTAPVEPTAPENPADRPEPPTGTSIATINDRGVITVAAADAKNVPVIELFEDPLCPFCGAFEQQYGAELAAAVDSGEVIVRYRTVTFLNSASSSGTYSTRALAALIALATKAGDEPGLVLGFHAALFNPAVQPAEGGQDLSNDDLAELADDLGAPPAAVKAIAKGQYVKTAAKSAERSLDRLRSLSDSPGTPSVAVSGERIPIGPGWLDALPGSG